MCIKKTSNRFLAQLLAACLVLNTALFSQTPYSIFADELYEQIVVTEDSAGVSTATGSDAGKKDDRSETSAVTESTMSDALYDEDGFLLDGNVSNDVPVEEIPEPEEKVSASSGDVREVILQDMSDQMDQDSDELLQGYFEACLQSKNDSVLLSGRLLEAPRGSSLSGKEARVYTFTKEKIEKIAAGELDSAEVFLPLSMFDIPGYDEVSNTITITRADVGASLISGTDFSPELDAYISGLEAMVDFDRDAVNAALLADCPFDFYWSNKWMGYVEDFSWSGIGDNDEVTLDVTEFSELCYQVDPEFRSSSGDEYSVDTGKTSLASAAAANAGAIVSDAASLTDLEKLAFYLEQICSLTDYDYAAAEAGTPDAFGTGGPWQVFYVFDENDDTKVVCEGYSKAFKYLCDLSSFTSSEIECYLVTGSMTAGTGAGAHMWNIVRMEDGKNYMVDVTNCDEGSAGYPDKLFLRGYSSQVKNGAGRQTGYGVETGSVIINYAYNEDTLDLYTAGEITLPGSDYPFPVTGVSLNQTSAVLPAGSTLTLTASVAPDNAGNKNVSWSSSNTAAAAVNSSGTVTAVAVGSAVITVTTEDGGYTAACAVTVTAPVVAVTGVTLNQTSAVLTEGETLTLKATVSPANATNKSVSWSSSNTAVAAVDQYGRITAKKAGTAIITVTTKDGGKTASCKVTVQALDPVEVFVRRLYSVCLSREADSGGLAYWKDLISSGKIKGIQLAGNFVFSDEFTSKNYCNEHFVRQVYPALMGRDPDAGGFSYWVGELNKGMKREAMLNSFASSDEYRGLCTDAGIALGPTIGVPKYGIQPYGPCAVCEKKTKVVQFVERMYTKCLNRTAEAGGLKYWSKELCNHTKTAQTLLHNFFLSDEIKKAGLSNGEYVKRVYRTMLDREPEPGGYNYWKGRLDAGETPVVIINGFIGSDEFIKICNDYGIQRK